MCCVGFHVLIYSSHACELSTTITCPKSSIDISITENNALEWFVKLKMISTSQYHNMERSILLNCVF